MNRTLKLSQTWCSNANTWAPDREKSRMVRCSNCGRRLKTYPVYDSWTPDELHGFKVPAHKTKPKPVRRSKGDRGAARARR